MLATMRRGVVLCLGSVVLLGGTTGPAKAHPHVWINDVTTYVFEDRHLVALRHRWEFDTLFSSFVIQEHDANGDGQFDAAETEAVQAAAFANLEEFDYFTHLRVDGEPVPLHEVENFAAHTADGVLIYEFTLPLPTPIDPAATDFAIGLYDVEYYVEVLPDEYDPVRFSGLPSGTCTFEIREDSDNPIYFGMVYPLVTTLNCATS